MTDLVYNPARAELLSFVGECANVDTLAVRDAMEAEFPARFLPRLSEVDAMILLGRLIEAQDAVDDAVIQRDHNPNHLAQRAAAESLPDLQDKLERVAHEALMQDGPLGPPTPPERVMTVPVDVELLRQRRKAVLQRESRSTLVTRAWQAGGCAMPISMLRTWNRDELVTQILNTEYPKDQS